MAPDYNFSFTDAELDDDVLDRIWESETRILAPRCGVYAADSAYLHPVPSHGLHHSRSHPTFPTATTSRSDRQLADVPTSPSPRENIFSQRGTPTRSTGQHGKGIYHNRYGSMAEKELAFNFVASATGLPSETVNQRWDAATYNRALVAARGGAPAPVLDQTRASEAASGEGFSDTSSLLAKKDLSSYWSQDSHEVQVPVATEEHNAQAFSGGELGDHRQSNEQSLLLPPPRNNHPKTPVQSSFPPLFSSQPPPRQRQILPSPSLMPPPTFPPLGGSASTSHLPLPRAPRSTAGFFYSGNNCFSLGPEAAPITGEIGSGQATSSGHNHSLQTLRSTASAGTSTPTPVAPFQRAKGWVKGTLGLTADVLKRIQPKHPDFTDPAYRIHPVAGPSVQPPPPPIPRQNPCHCELNPIPDGGHVPNGVLVQEETLVFCHHCHQPVKIRAGTVGELSHACSATALLSRQPEPNLFFRNFVRLVLRYQKPTTRPGLNSLVSRPVTVARVDCLIMAGFHSTGPRVTRESLDKVDRAQRALPKLRDASGNVLAPFRGNTRDSDTVHEKDMDEKFTRERWTGPHWEVGSLAAGGTRRRTSIIWREG
ncbi:hypothetical protein BKA70DRAFT_1223589 [Coprinopsis sp. MPI-PUGE-AT-0042]|nr:hypothetical protein BKA70DRAFT_1223589 [Coprinopsis sp. MPI-PUGE-AT-0042]